MAPMYNLKTCKTPKKECFSVKLQALTCKFTRSNSPQWAFSTFFKLYKRNQIAQPISNVIIKSASVSDLIYASLNGTKYSRMDQVKTAFKKFTWSILEHFFSSVKCSGFITFDTLLCFIGDFTQYSLTCLKIGLQNKSESRIPQKSKMERFETVFNSYQLYLLFQALHLRCLQDP